jgi:hypothetical protein
MSEYQHSKIIGSDTGPTFDSLFYVRRKEDHVWFKPYHQKYIFDIDRSILIDAERITPFQLETEKFVSI